MVCLVDMPFIRLDEEIHQTLDDVYMFGLTDSLHMSKA